MQRFLTLIALLTLMPPAIAGAWVTESSSTLKFQAVQQNARFEGEFGEFTASIDFDPAAPETGSISASVDLGSVDTNYGERDDYLRGAEWFFIERWPQATFTAATIKADAAGFVAAGKLNLRGIVRPVELRFTFTTTPVGARLTGTADLLRLDFGVGTGDWEDTEWVANEVTVLVDLQLSPASTTN